MNRQRGRAVQYWGLILAITISSIGLPACTGAQSPMPQVAHSNATAAAHDAPAEAMAPVFYDDSNGLRNLETIDEGCVDAMYWSDEPISSQMTLTSAAELEEACNKAQIACMNRCMNNPNPPYPAQKKGDRAHYAHCHKRCLKQFMECMRKAGLLQEFTVLDAAWAWIKKHGTAIVGTIVIVGGVAYIVSTAGSGALVLVIL